MKQKMNFQLASMLVVALAMIASACTKNKELKNGVDPNAYLAKSALVGKTFHFSSGVEDAASDNTVGATPGMSEDFGLVKARITEDELQFIQVYDPNGRPVVNSIIASYKITKQFDIQRDKNDYGDQTNKIIEDQTNPWDQRAYMRVDWAHPQNALSKFSHQLSGRALNKKDGDKKSGEDSNGADYSEENTTLLEDPKFEAGHISFLVETAVNDPANDGTYILPYGITTAKSYRVVYRTHLMEFKPTDFQPVSYTLKDFERFGYFFTQQDLQDPRGLLQKNQSLYANVHNVCEAGRAGSCSTNKIVWVLSKDFPEKYKATARKVVQEWNVTFKSALNRQDDVVVLDESKQATISDPSQNVLAYYPSRTKSGLLGVAQWVSNPITGELVGVRATVYGDGIDYVVANVDDKINLLVSNDPLKDIIGTSGFGEPLTYVSPFDDKGMMKMMAADKKTLGLNKKRVNTFNSTPMAQIRTARASLDTAAGKQVERLVNLVNKVPSVTMSKESALVEEDAKTRYFPATIGGFKIPTLAGMEQIVFAEAKIAADKRAVLMDSGSGGVHGTELVEDAAVRYLYKYLADGATKQDLDSNRQRIEDEIAQLTFYTTALHEMGHAFGLRHNFAGSADQEHFPQEYKDIAAKLAAGDKSVVKEDLDPYAASSIMDYTRDFFDQKNGLGTYDKAAIKYTYNRSINRESDPVTLAHYKFCTDHQVGENLLCQRFDKGHNVTEMVQGDVDLYDHNYALWHYRRGRLSENNPSGWGSPAALTNRLLTSVFLPIRQTMDEFIYSIISAQSAQGEGLCGYLFIKKSIDAGEMASICNATEMEATHVDQSDLSTLTNALYKYDEKGNPVGLLKAPSTYIPYGGADLLYANALAMNFFQRVIGAPEPGTYLATPMEDGTVSLKEIDAAGDLTAQATEIAQDLKMNPAMATPWIKAASNYTTEIKVGGYGRQLDSRTSSVAGYTTNESLGSWYDKVAAVKALAIPGGWFTRKYVTDSMNGNSYVWPQTKPWTSEIVKKLISGDKSVATVPVVLKGGMKIMATVPSATNLDLQGMTSMYAIALMSSSTDKSMSSKLQICDINEAQCAASTTGSKAVEFHAADGGNVYRAIQTTQNDSISFDIVASAKVIDDSRTAWVKIRDNIGKAQTENLLVLDSSDALLASIIEKIKADPTLSVEKPDNQNLWTDIIPAEWSTMRELTKQVLTLSPNQGYTAGLEVLNAFGILSQNTDKALAAMGDAGKCWVQAKHPEAVPKEDPSNSSLNSKLNATLSNAPAISLENKPIANNAPATNKKACGVSSTTDPVNNASGDQAEALAGQKRLNLLLLAADLKNVDENYMQKIVVIDIKSLFAPAQINGLTNQLRSKEALIDQIRELMK